jgi:hypothetical protein
MTDMISCPADGCDYSGLRESVLGHYSGKQDSAHQGGYQKAKTMLEGDTDATETTESTDTDTDDTPDDTNTRDSPVMGDANPEQAAQSSSDGVELPCGHESYDPGEAPSAPFAVSCSECGKAWEVQE